MLSPLEAGFVHVEGRRNVGLGISQTSTLCRLCVEYVGETSPLPHLYIHTLKVPLPVMQSPRCLSELSSCDHPRATRVSLLEKTRAYIPLRDFDLRVLTNGPYLCVSSGSSCVSSYINNLFRQVAGGRLFQPIGAQKHSSFNFT